MLIDALSLLQPKAVTRLRFEVDLELFEIFLDLQALSFVLLSL